MFRRIPSTLAKELLDSGLVYHDSKPYNVVRSGKGRWMYTKVETAATWPRVMDWDSTQHPGAYIYFLHVEE